MKKTRACSPVPVTWILYLALLTLGAERPAQAAPFADGDLHLVSRSLPTIGDGILRIDPATGATSVLVDLPNTQPLIGTFSYDAYRDRLLFLDTATIGMQTVDAAGAVATIGTGGNLPALVAARGDGIVYLWFGPAIGFGYLDASDVLHALLDASASATFTFPVGTQLQEMIYDPDTNSLLCFSATAFAPCAVAGQTCAVQIPLTSGGTQVAGALAWAQVNVSASGGDVDGASLVPGGSVLVIVDTNDNLQSPRMQLLDPAAMTFSTFASNGPYAGAAATDAGAWNAILGKALILDTGNDVLRSFGSGEVGTGTVFATGVSSVGSSSEDARLVQIVTGPPPVPALPAWGLAGLASAIAALVAIAALARPRGVA